MPALFIDAERLRDLTSGLGQVCLHLGHELVRQKPKDWTITFLVPAGQSGIFGNNVQYIDASWLRKIWMPGPPGGNQYTVWHCLHQDSAYLPRQSGAKVVLTIHDLNFLERPDYSPEKKARKLAQLQRTIDRAAALTAISEYTASVMNEHLRIPVDRPIQIIYNGVAVDPANAPIELPADSVSDALSVRSVLEAPFFLFLGVIHPKKNVHTLLPLLEAFPDYQLVLAGPDGHPYMQHIREQAQKLGISDQLIVAGAVDEPTKLWLYAHCDAFLFPSISEGFGLPVVEAMTFGKPVFISRLTSLPEVGGKEAYYFDNFDSERMAQTLDEGLRDFAQNPLRQERMKKRAAGFSWPKAANEYWKVYQRVAE